MNVTQWCVCFSEVCTGHCSRYQFMCDDGCCIDIGYACDGKQHCPDRSDEDFCQNCKPRPPSSQKPFQYLNYLKTEKNGLVCFIVNSGHKSNPPSKHDGPDIQTEAEAQTPTEIQLNESPKPEQHQHYDFSSQGKT